jgi:hypothetical protein
MKTPFKKASAPRPKQETPGDIVNDLMQAVRSGFYQDDPGKWFADQHFIKRNVILWPAAWLNKKAVTLPPERYKSILMEIFQGIKQHGDTGAVRYWPGYLMRCVQDHFKVHGEEYYEEGKSIRAKAEILLTAFSRAHVAPRGVDQVETMAAAHSILTSHKSKKKAVKPADQLSLL